MFHTLKPNEVPGEDWLVKNMQSLEPPSLIIVCELSSYFTNVEGVDSLATSTLPAYMNLVSRAMILRSNIGAPGSRPKIALFDSRLSTLKLPVTQKSTMSFRSPHDEIQQQPTQQVFPLIKHFFEYIALFDQDPIEVFIPSSQGDEDETGAFPRRRLKVYSSSQQADECPEISWSENTKTKSTRRQSYFGWDR
ncbi:hypothetical protein BJ165DRAFT_29561 [Panaeolus papilionaceus]|nr:hypothetical protein BJ165DRAFT_29561 [Panaeolus papilionaceus]